MALERGQGEAPLMQQAPPEVAPIVHQAPVEQDVQQQATTLLTPVAVTEDDTTVATIESIVVEPSPPAINIKDKLKGMLWGCALGDALGMPYEFMYGQYPFKLVIQQHNNLPLGQISDDTEMMMALLQSVVLEKTYNRDKVIEAYCKWVASGPWDLGQNTAMLFRHTVMAHQGTSAYVRSYDIKMAEMSKQPQDRWSQSNGCLMRCMPLALFNEAYKVWVRDCMISNPHPICIEACTVYFKMIYYILKGENMQNPVHISWSSVPEIQQAIQDVLVLKNLNAPGKRDVSKQRGWVVHALYFAMVMYQFPFTTIEQGMQFVIGHHLDSDTDTNGAIAAALLGCKLGYESMYNNEVTKHNIELIKGCNPQRPAEYHPKLIDILIEQVNL